MIALQTHWHSQRIYLQRNGLLFVVALVVIYLVLKVDLSIVDDSLVNIKKINVTLSKDTLKKPVEEVKPDPVAAELIDPDLVEKTKVLSQKSKPLPSPSKKPNRIEKKTQLKKQEAPKPTVELKQNLPSSGDILNSFYSGKSKNQELTDDFKVFTEPNMDFIYFEVEEPDWNKVVKMVNEEIDKPRTQMKFYANGLEGKVERLMDKITIKKTFTTKYGTKITCGLVGVFVACGWK